MTLFDIFNYSNSKFVSHRHTVVQTNHTRAQNLLYINSKSARNDTRGERKCNSINSSNRLFIYRHGNL